MAGVSRVYSPQLCACNLSVDFQVNRVKMTRLL